MNCRNCGKEIANNMKFCPECGEKALYEIEVIEPEISLIESENKNTSEIQNEEILNVSDDFSTKCKRLFTNKKIIIQKIISLLVGLVFLAWMNSYYHQKQDEKLQEKLEISYSLGVESLSKGDFKKAEKEFSAFGENSRVISRETDYVVASKHYQDAYILRYYAVAGKEFEKGADPTDTLDKIPNNYSGLFSREIIALKKSVREMKEKIAAEKEAAEKEKKRKAEEERQRIVQEQEQQRKAQKLAQMQENIGLKFTEISVEPMTIISEKQLTIRITFRVTNLKNNVQHLSRHDFIARKNGYNTVKEGGLGGGGFSSTSPSDTFDLDAVDLFPGDSKRASFDFYTHDKPMNISGWSIYYMKSGSEFYPFIEI